MNHLLLRLKRTFWRYRCQHPALYDILTSPIPKIDPKHSRYVVIDLETTALDCKQGEIASIGWVVIENNRIQLNQAQHHLVSLKKEVGQSAIYHQMTDTDLTHAEPIKRVLDALIHAITNSILVFHHAPLDMAFLNQSARDHFGAPILLPIMDTLILEKKTLDRRKYLLEAEDLRLYRCRQRYGLYNIPAHNALHDAIATAELFLAILSQTHNL